MVNILKFIKNLKRPYELPKNYKQNRKIVIKPAKGCKFPFKRKNV